MAGVCRWCGAFCNSDLHEHEDVHRQLDMLGGLCNGTQATSSTMEALQEIPTSLTEDPNMESQDTVGRKEDIPARDTITPNNNSPPYSCNKCLKTFTRKDSRRRHEKTCLQRQDVVQLESDLFPRVNSALYTCANCPKSFDRKDNKLRHEKACHGNQHICPQCHKKCASDYGLRRHILWHDKNNKRTTSSTLPSKEKTRQKDISTTPANASFHTPSQYRCRRCTQSFSSRHDLYLHGMREHYNQVGGALQIRPWNDDNAPWMREGEDEGLRQVYEANAPLILETHRRGPIQSVYNFPLDNDVTLVQLMDFATEIYRREQRAFRLNMVFGVILQHRETGRYRYFVPYNNNGIFERPVYISRRTDLNHLRNRLRRKEIMTELLRIRPDTKWIPVLVTNVHYTVYSTNYPLGMGVLPDYLLQKKSLYSLAKNIQNSIPYEDNLCAFRCLALHRGHKLHALERPAMQLYEQWTDEPVDSFGGLDFSEFPEFENRFGVNVEVYNLSEDGFASSIYKSRGQHPSTMYLNLYENHLSYIRTFAAYAQKFQCKTCQRHFTRCDNLHRHQRVCSDKTQYVYPGGFHRAQDSIFDRLSDFGIDVPKEDRYFPWYICYDFEAMLEKIHERPTDQLQWTHKHVPISVSICSNVEGHTDPVCIVEPDQNNLIRGMVSTMNAIAERVLELAEDKWAWLLRAIDNKIDEDGQWEQGDEYPDETKEDEATNIPRHPLCKVYGKLEAYMSQVPVLGFNSAKYDLNLIKKCLAKHLNMHEDTDNFVVKNNNAYTCISTQQFKFLDMSQYLAPGSSYAGFLKAYGVQEAKGFFPYEWFNTLAKLDVNTLPSHQDFYSSLKDTNISQDEYNFCQRVWRDNNMSTFREFLVWYNNLDVEPFVSAVERFQAFYFNKGIDVFKSAISIPGIARQLLFRTAREQNANFSLCDRNSSDLYRTIKQNIVGGPSIIFTRRHCAGKTRIRGEKITHAILGFDANALYLQSIGREMPVGPFIRRRADNDFRPELRDRYMSAYYWMEWLMHTRRVSIQHKLNSGREVRIGKYPVDGYTAAFHPEERPTVYQYHGCYWHGHNCYLTKNIKDEEWKAKRDKKYQKTLEITASLKRECHVEEMWECQFGIYCQKNPAIYDFISSSRPGFFQNHRGTIEEKHILRGVVIGELFGMVEVDIRVPDEWPSHFQDPRMTPYQYFEEMSPLFCSADIPYDAIGEHMQQHVVANKLSKEPRRLLIGGMKAQQILLATPLLQWYLNHGLHVTKVYQVVEYQSQRCFQQFVKEVSDARRLGDRDPDTAIIADTSKVIGNSSYGSLIMDKTKQRNVKFVQGENETCLKVNDPWFRKLECLDQEEQYYEIEMAKRQIKLDLPIQLGYFILQYAKLRMLEFYYDFMDVYVDRSDFEYCEMDTDSAYMAISGTCLEEVIKPEMKRKYQFGLQGFCTDTDIEADAVHHWFPRTCCPDHAKYDKRTPGLFKLEYRGNEMIGLSSKTYIVRKQKTLKPTSTRIAAYHLLRRSLKLKRKRCLCRHRITNEYKVSSKGVSKRTLKSPMTKFRSVLSTRKPQSGNNRGFRVRNNAVFTYTQERRGFSYFYCKRKVSDDGIHTAPLDITLCPLKQQEDQDLIEATNFED